LYRGLEKNGMVREWHGRGVASVNQTRPHCVNQMEETHSKPLATKGHHFIGAFAKLRKATISFVMLVRPSVRTEQLGSHWSYFIEIWYLRIFRKYFEKKLKSL
jgi:hypothetical protein